MSDSASIEARRRLAGIGLMIAAVAAFAVLDATAKYLVATLGTGLVIFARYAFSLILVAVWVSSQTGVSLLVTRNPGLQVARGLLLVISTSGNFLALNYLQLAQTSSITFSNPLWVCALSPLLLGERVGPRRWFAVVVGFVGVLAIIRPGTADFHWAMLASLTAALSGALYQIATRKVGADDRAITSLFYVMLVGSFATAPLSPIGWVSPEPWQWLLLALLGVYGGAGHFMLTQAHRMAPAPVLAPFLYTQIVWMILIGYIVFGDMPDAMTVAGGAAVVASGLYVLYRERQVRKPLGA